MKLQTVLFLNIFFPNSVLRNQGCGLSKDAAYTRTFTVFIINITSVNKHVCKFGEICCSHHVF